MTSTADEEKQKQKRKRLCWDLQTMQNGSHGFPEIVGDIRVQSYPPEGDSLNTIQKLSDLPTIHSVLDFPIYMPDQGWKIPVWIEHHFGSIIDQVRKHENQYEDFEDRYVYITVDQRWLTPNTHHRRPGFHSDGFALNLAEAVKNQEVVDHTYIVSDVLPTEFIFGGFPLQSFHTDEEALEVFESESINRPIGTFPCSTLLMLTPYVIHRTPFYNGIEPIRRTFIKISVSKRQFRRQGNTHNDLFHYDWVMLPRHQQKRNHPY